MPCEIPLMKNVLYCIVFVLWSKLIGSEEIKDNCSTCIDTEIYICQCTRVLECSSNKTVFLFTSLSYILCLQFLFTGHKSMCKSLVSNWPCAKSMFLLWLSLRALVLVITVFCCWMWVSGACLLRQHSSIELRDQWNSPIIFILFAFYVQSAILVCPCPPPGSFTI